MNKTLITVIVIVVVLLILLLLLSSFKSSTNKKPGALIGKDVFSGIDGVPVYKDGSLKDIYETAKKDQWIGTVENDSDPQWLMVSGGYYVARKLVKVKPKSKAATSSSIHNNSIFPLKKGSTGKEVKMLQTYLRSLDSTALPTKGIDGVFGTETEDWSVKLLGKSDIDEGYFNSVVKPGYTLVSGIIAQVNTGLSSFGFRRS